MDYVIKFPDGAYNEGQSGTPRNGFPVDFSEASRYATLEQAEEKASELRNPDGSGVEIQIVGNDGVPRALDAERPDEPATDLSSEIHPILNKMEMAEIKEFREKLAYKTQERSKELYYEWAVNGKLTLKQHTLLGQYLFCE